LIYEHKSNYTLNGSYPSPPVDWLSEGLNAGEQVDVERNTSGLHTPIVSLPDQEHDNLDRQGKIKWYIL
jgi:hypothetical protein